VPGECPGEGIKMTKYPLRALAALGLQQVEMLAEVNAVAKGLDDSLSYFGL